LRWHIRLTQKRYIMRTSLEIYGNYRYSPAEIRIPDSLGLQPKEVQIEKGSFLFREGDHLDRLYILREGAFFFSRLDSQGQSQILRILGPGELLGKHGVFTGAKSLYSAKALANCSLYAYEKQELEKELEDDSEIFRFLFNRLMVEYRTQVVEQQIFTAHYSIPSRLAALLLLLLDKFGTESDRSLNISLKRSEMASILGTSAEYVIHLLSGFKKRQIIAMPKNRIVILAEAKLRALSF